MSIDRIFGAGQANYSTGIQKTNKADKALNISFTSNVNDVQKDGWSNMGLNISNPTEARMQQFFENDPKMKILDEMTLS